MTSFEELRLTGNLPSPSGVGLSILQVTQNDDYTAEQLAQTIQSDPALTGRIIKLANSAQVGGVKKITTVADAVVRLGASAVRNVALGFSLVSGYRSGRCAAFDFSRFWSESLARAIVAQEICRELRLGPPAEAYVCGLLASIGRLALAAVHPQAYSELLTSLGSPDVDRLLAAEHERFGIDHRAVAGAMLTDWRLPDAQRDALVDPDPRSTSGALAARPLRRVLGLASPVAAIYLAAASDLPYHFKRLEQAAEHERDLTLEKLFQFADAAQASWLEWGGLLALPTQRVAPLAEMRATLADAPPPEPVAETVPEVGRKDESDPSIHNPVELARGSVDAMLRRWQDEELTRERTVVLAADDDALSRRVLVTHLKKAGYQVVEARDGREALAKVLEHNPHIVITDWQMPEIDGVALTARLRETEFGRKMFVLVLTGSEGEQHVLEAFGAGADDYIAKPVNPRVLLARVGAGERIARLQDRVERDQARLRQHLADMAILNRKLRQANVTDPLTSLPNRRYAMKLLDELWARADASWPISVIAIDVDHFKKINETLGHEGGDLALKHVARVLSRHIRPTDRVCRIGSEEFVVICPGCAIGDAGTVAERLRAAVAASPLVVRGEEHRVTISAGFAMRSPRTGHHDELLRVADDALFAAKREGRNRVKAGAAA
jgi:two-component system cell cycle response regulator